MKGGQQASALTIRMHGCFEVELTCECAFRLVQKIRAAIAPRCPKCGRRWR